jgi:putative membrane protein
MKTLGAAVGKVDASQQRIADTAGKIADAAADVHTAATGINQHADQITGKLTDAKTKLDDLADGADEVASGAHQLHDKLADAADGAHTLADGVGSADTGAHRLDDGLANLSSGAAQLDSGIGTLHTGAQKLDSGIATLQSGARTLDGGLATLDHGAHQLHDGLADGLGRLPELTPGQQHDAAQVLSSPADVALTIDHPAKVYGRGLAPFFFAIAIWVFGISAFLVLRPISGRALAGRANAARLALAGWIPVAGMAILGSLILLVVSWFALGLDPVHAAASFGVVILAAACFSAIAHVLRTALGTVGSAITLVLLMVQLTSCGGLYPIQTLPAPLRAIHPYIPMSYLVDGLRITFTGGPIGHLWRDVAVLAGFAIAALVACVAVVARRKRFRMTDLYPALA